MLSCIRAEQEGNMLEVLSLGNPILKAISYFSEQEVMEDEVMKPSSSSIWKKRKKKMGDGIAKEENLETQIIPLTNENISFQISLTQQSKRNKLEKTIQRCS
jgi:hypothetical protein